MSRMPGQRDLIVGRDSELAVLSSALVDAIHGRGQITMLVGEPGIGKSRTAEERAQRAEKLDTAVLWGRGSEERGIPSYWPWVQIIRACTAKYEVGELRSALGIDSELIAGIVPELSDLIDLPTATGRPPDPDEAQFRLYDAVLRFMSELSQTQPMVLIFDDLHWADSASLKLLEHFVRGLAQSRILILGTYRDVELSRDHPLFRTLGDLTRSRSFNRIQLRGLDLENVGKVIEAQSGKVPSSDLVATVHNQTEGNPLFVGEMARLIVQEGLFDTESISGSPRGELRLPEGVREVIGRRLDHLSEPANSLLVTAAVIGRDFTLNQLGAAEEDLTANQLSELLEEPLSTKIIEEVATDYGRYRFTHVMIQQVLRDQLSLTRRVRLHARIGEPLEALYGDSADSHASELAYHFTEAEKVLGSEKMIAYSIIAGEKSLREFAFVDAVSHFERALEAQADNPIDDTRARTLHGYGVGQAAVAEMGKSLDAMNEAFDYYIESGQDSRAIEVAVHSNVNLEDPLFIRRARQAVDAVKPGSPYEPYLLSRYAMAVSLSWEAREEKRADELDSLAIKSAEVLGDKNAQVLVRSTHSMLLWTRGEIPKALEWARGALEFVDETTRAFPETNAAMWAACCAVYLGSPEEARKYSIQASVASERSHDPYRILSRIIMATACISDAVGDFDALLEHTRQAYALVPGNVTRIGGYVKLAFAGAGAHFERGDTDAGKKLFDETVDFVHQGDDKAQTMLALPRIAHIARLTGDPGHLQVVRELLEWIDPAIHARGWRLSDPLARAIVATIDNDPEAAGNALTELAGLKPGIGHYAPSNSRVMGLAARTAGDFISATVHFEDSLEFCRNAGYLPELAWTCHDFAEMMVAEPGAFDQGKFTALLDEGIAAAGQIGMTTVIGQMEKLNEVAGHDSAANPAGLTDRQVEILALVAAGLSNPEIGNKLFISTNTVDRHLSNIFTKIDVANRVEATTFALASGISSIGDRD